MLSHPILIVKSQVKHSAIPVFENISSGWEFIYCIPSVFMNPLSTEVIPNQSLVVACQEGHIDQYKEKFLTPLIDR